MHASEFRLASFRTVRSDGHWCVSVSWQMLDVPTVLNLLRQQRMMMVQTLSQYTFIYKVLIQFLRNSRLIWDQRWHGGDVLRLPWAPSQPLSPPEPRTHRTGGGAASLPERFLTVLVTGRDTSRGKYEGRCAALSLTSIIHRFHCGLLHVITDGSPSTFILLYIDANDAALLFNTIRWTAVVLLYRVPRGFY